MRKLRSYHLDCQLLTGGSFFNYVDQISPYYWPPTYPPIIGWWGNSFTLLVNLSLTFSVALTYLPCLVNVVCERPLAQCSCTYIPTKIVERDKNSHRHDRKKSSEYNSMKPKRYADRWWGWRELLEEENEPKQIYKCDKFSDFNARQAEILLKCSRVQISRKAGSSCLTFAVWPSRLKLLPILFSQTIRAKVIRYLSRRELSLQY